MTEKSLEERLDALIRQVEALEARLAELESPRALREAGPVYQVEGTDEFASTFEDRLEALFLEFAQLVEDWRDVRAMQLAEEDYRAGDTLSFDDFFAELDAEAE